MRVVRLNRLGIAACVSVILHLPIMLISLEGGEKGSAPYMLSVTLMDRVDKNRVDKDKQDDESSRNVPPVQETEYPPPALEDTSERVGLKITQAMINKAIKEFLASKEDPSKPSTTRNFSTDDVQSAYRPLKKYDLGNTESRYFPQLNLKASKVSYSKSNGDLVRKVTDEFGNIRCIVRFGSEISELNKHHQNPALWYILPPWRNC